MVSPYKFTDPEYLNLDTLSQTITTSADGNTVTIVATDGTHSWTQTIVTAGSVVSVSTWTKT